MIKREDAKARRSEGKDGVRMPDPFNREGTPIDAKLGPPQLGRGTAILDPSG